MFCLNLWDNNRSIIFLLDKSWTSLWLLTFRLKNCLRLGHGLIDFKACKDSIEFLKSDIQIFLCFASAYEYMKGQRDHIEDIFSVIVAKTTQVCEKIILSCYFSVVFKVIVQVLFERRSLEISLDWAWWPFKMWKTLIGWQRLYINPSRFVLEDFCY